MKGFTFSYPKKWRSPYATAKMFIIIVIILVVSRGIMHYLQTQYSEIIDRQKEIVVINSGKMNSYFAGRMMALELTAADRDIKSLNPEVMQSTLNQLTDVLGLFGAGVYSRQGNYIAGTKNIYPGPITDYDNFKLALSCQKVISNRLDNYGSENQYISLRVPIYIDKENKAVLAAALPLSAITDLVEKENLSQSDYFFIIDGDGKLIYHPKLKFISEEKIIFDTYKNFFITRNGSTVEYSALDDTQRVYVFSSIDYTNWRVVMTTPLNKIYWHIFWKSVPDLMVLFLLLVLIYVFMRVIKQKQTHRQTLETLMMERMSCVNQLAAGIAHEIRNPLTSIKGFIQLIENKKEYDVPKKYLDIILSEIARIDKLINEFRLLSRPVELSGIIGPVDIVSVTDDVVVLMESQALAKNVIMTFNHQDMTCFVRGDISQLKQVLINLIKNALEAVPSGGKVAVTVTSREQEIIVQVADNGVGIPDDIITKLGRPFFTTKENGTGLGLSLCYSIVNQHRGKLEVASEEGKGTIFTIYLPSYNQLQPR